MEINIKLNENFLLNLITKMDSVKHLHKETHVHYYKMYIQQEMSKGMNEFHASVKFLMDENVPQKYKDTYRKNQNQMIESMDLDEFPEKPKLVRT
jgi:hypothetical protein